MHIYAFGSLCRGEIGLDSDIDLLAIVDQFDERLDQKLFSIYSVQADSGALARGESICVASIA